MYFALSCDIWPLLYPPKIMFATTGTTMLKAGCCPRLPHWRAAQGGFSVLEAAVAGAIAVILLAGLFVLNSDVMRLLRSSTEAANASQHLQTRVEQVRLANWNQLTDPTWVQGTLLANPTDADSNLSGLSETFTITPYPSPCSSPSNVSPPPPFTVTRQADGSTSVAPSGYGYSTVLANQEMLRIDLAITWPSWGRTRTRTQTTLISPWGISK